MNEAKSLINKNLVGVVDFLTCDFALTGSPKFPEHTPEEEVFDFLSKNAEAALAGDAEAAFMLGDAYLSCCDDFFFQFTRKATDEKNPRPENPRPEDRLDGTVLTKSCEGFKPDQEYSAEATCWLQLALDNDSLSAYRLIRNWKRTEAGYLYKLYGVEVLKLNCPYDANVKYNELLLKAVAEGNADAMFEQADRLLKGEGADTDKDKALALLRKSADNGNADAVSKLAELYLKGEYVSKDVAEAIRLYEKALADGNDWAAGMLAAIYRHGNDGVPASPQKAFHYLKVAGSSFKLDVADAYFAGNGVEQDKIAAAEIYLDCCMVSVCDGNGVWDEIEGKVNSCIDAIITEAEGGDPRACKCLGDVYNVFKVNGVDRRDSSIEWYEKASEAGLWDATHKLLSIYAAVGWSFYFNDIYNNPFRCCRYESFYSCKDKEKANLYAAKLYEQALPEAESGNRKAMLACAHALHVSPELAAAGSPSSVDWLRRRSACK